MDELGALGLDPAEPPAERCLDLALHRVGLVARHPPPPLHLRVAEAPRRPRPAAAPGGRRQRRRRRPGGRLDDDVEAAVAVRHHLVAVGAVELPGVGGGRGRGRVGAVRAVVVGGGHREATRGGPRGSLVAGWRERGAEKRRSPFPVLFFLHRRC